MGIFSILPERLFTIETCITRIFLFIAVFLIGPWVALLVYDLFLYIFRAITYEVPVIGGRARGKARPRAPSLTERPSGRKRRFSLARGSRGSSSNITAADLPDARFRDIAEEKGSLTSTA